MAADGYDSPGWKRLQSNHKRSTAGPPKDNLNLIIDATASSVFVIGDRVFHQKFGYGKIKEIEAFERYLKDFYGYCFLRFCE